MTRLLIFALFLFGCEVPKPPPNLATLENNLKKIQADIDKKEKERTKLKKEISDKEDDLDDLDDDLEEVEDDLEEVKEQLRNSRLTPQERRDLESQRDRLQADKTRIQAERDRIQTELNSLKADKARLEGELATARTEKETAEREKREAETRLTAERDCWKKTKYGVCERTPKVRDAIVAKINGKNACADIHYCDLETITELDLSGDYEGPSENARLPCRDNTFAFNKDDFKGLIELLELDLSGNCLYSNDAGIDLEAKDNEGIFSHLTKIRKIKLHDTGVGRLPRDFFTADNIRTLEDGEVTVTDFIYCNDPVVLYKNKLSQANITPHNDRAYKITPGHARMKADYCY